jgi:nicotinate-nucleotide adenylyltransferase
MGGDAFAEIATWKDYDRLLTQADFVVIIRPAYQFNKAEEVIRQCFKKYRYHSRESVWLPENGKGGKIYFPETKPIAVSSTEIRRMVQAGRSIQQMVPPEVEMYIREHRLYRDIE